MKLKNWMLASLLLAVMPVGASSLFQPVEISDAEMSALRGRYILPEGIVNFGVTMSTSWRNSSGATIGAQVNLTVNNLAANLTVTPLYSIGNGNLPTVGPGQIIGGQGLNNVQGISQSVRTAGDYNNGENYVDVNITHAAGQPIGEGARSSAMRLAWCKFLQLMAACRCSCKRIKGRARPVSQSGKAASISKPISVAS